MCKGGRDRTQVKAYPGRLGYIGSSPKFMSTQNLRLWSHLKEGHVTMRSCKFRVSPKSKMTGVLVRRGTLDTDTQGQPRDDRQRWQMHL